MYNTNNILNKQKTFIEKADILNKVSEYDILRKYIVPFKIGKIYNSPIRDDKNPSFGIFISNRDNALLYKDLATGDCGDVFKLIKKIKNITNNAELYKTIYEELSLSSPDISVGHKRMYKSKSLEIKISRQKFRENDLQFWSQFGITLPTLTKFKVDPISKYLINNIVQMKYSETEPMYAYKVFNKFKIYRPLSKKTDKWRGNLSSLDIQGYEHIPENGDLLIITKSLKDVMTLYELGYVAVAPASESTLVPEIVMSNLKNRFKKLVVFYDRDKAGVKFAREMVQKHNIDFMFINKKHKTKDISDFVKKYNLAEAAKMLKMELKNDI